MKERPILFSGEMVRALLAGTKTQTRRVMKPQPQGQVWHDLDNQQWLVSGYGERGDDLLHCPYGQPGDQLWVREAFMHEPADYCWEASVSIPCRPAETVYRADFPNSQPGEGWKPSIHMPRALSRITLEIIGVRVERLQGISEEDADAEGFAGGYPWELAPDIFTAPRDRWGSMTIPECFGVLWDQINGAGSWDANPWVWVVEFKRLP